MHNGILRWLTMMPYFPFSSVPYSSNLSLVLLFSFMTFTCYVFTKQRPQLQRPKVSHTVNYKKQQITSI